MLAGVFQFLFQPSVSTLALVRSLTQRANAVNVSGSVGIQIRARGLSFNDDGTAVGSFVELDAFIGCAVELIKAKLPSNGSSRIALHAACDNPTVFPRLEQMLAAAKLTSRVAVVLPDADAVSGSGFRKSVDADRYAVADIARVAQSDVVLISSHPSSSYGSIIANLHSGASSRFTAGDVQICALYPNTDGSCGGGARSSLVDCTGRCLLAALILNDRDRPRAYEINNKTLNVAAKLRRNREAR
jgi:hypothetical protein